MISGSSEGSRKIRDVSTRVEILTGYAGEHLTPHRTTPPGEPVARVVVDVMLKPEILDPQGQAVQRALPRLGFEGISDVRQGKRFELEVEGPVDDAALARIREMAETFLANTVIEDFAVKVES
jgi:phosphoribosylformylglycinamidine synthase